MNLLLKIAPTLALAGTLTLAHAQTPVMREEGHMPTKGKRMLSKGMEDCALMSGGKMMRVQNGQKMALTETMTMNNGTKVMADGKVEMAGGQTMMLHNGQCVMMDGQVKDIKMKGK